MIEAVVWGGATGGLFMLMSGLRRLPWRHGAVVGLGGGIVFGALRLSMVDVDPALRLLVDPSVLVLTGAFGGGLAQFAFDRGEDARQRRSAAILGTPTA